MKILITSGGTTEKIDSVRGITNHATGSLGKYIAEIFLQNGQRGDFSNDQRSCQTSKTTIFDNLISSQMLIVWLKL